MTQTQAVGAPQVAIGKYLYCIIACEEPRRFATRGIGEQGDVVHTVHYMDLAAVASDSPIVEYESSRRNLMAHTLVLEEVMREFVVLPVRFGTVAPSAGAIQDKVLKRRFGAFHALLSEMGQYVELGLKAFWYEQGIFQEIVDEHPAIRQLRDALQGRPAEATYYQRLQLGQLIEQAMERKRDHDAEQILAPLRSIVHQTRDGKVLTERMVLNVAFLVDKARQQAFDEAINALDRQMGHRLVLKVVGPVPPYNFVNISVQWDD